MGLLSEYGIGPIVTNELPENADINIPNGIYGFEIEEAELRSNKSNSGCYFNLKCKIITAPYTGAKFFVILNYINQNEDAQNIGRRDLRKILSVNRVVAFSDTNELIGLRFNGQVKLQKSKDPAYPDRPIITDFLEFDPSKIRIEKETPINQVNQFAPPKGAMDYPTKTPQAPAGFGVPQQPKQQATIPQFNAGFTGVVK